MAVSKTLTREGQPELAAHVRQFSEQMPPPRTEKEWMATKLAVHMRGGSRSRKPNPLKTSLGRIRRLACRE